MNLYWGHTWTGIQCARDSRVKGWISSSTPFENGSVPSPKPTLSPLWQNPKSNPSSSPSRDARWKTISLKCRSDSGPTRKRIPSGSLAVYVGLERRRFVIPTRFLNLPLFASLLDKAEEEYGFQSNGGLVLPCEVDFFKGASWFHSTVAEN